VNAGSQEGVGVDCAQVVELITEYLEGHLDPAMTAEVEAHLAECEGCQVYLEQMRQTIGSLGRVPLGELSPQVRAELLAAFGAMRGGPS